jgi:hypothetical protein
MPQWDSKQFEQKASEIAKTANAGQGSLHDLTVKLAKEKGLNEEQIRRLGRAVNVKAFEEKFASMKGKQDRIVDFEPVNSESVIQSLFSAASGSEKKASAAFPALADEMRSDRGWAPMQTKTASVDVKEEMLRAVPKAPPIEAQISHLQKVAEELGVKMAGAEIRWDDSMEQLREHSRRLHWNRDEFEKDALALYGDDVLFEINALRQSARLPEISLSKQAAAKLANSLFGEETEDTKLLKTAADANKEYVRASRALVAAKIKIAELRKSVFR